MKRYTFVVTGWNCEDWVRQCMDSILSQRIPQNCTRRILAVDDGSTDATGTLLFDYNSRDVELIFFRENQGAAFSRYIALTNPEYWDSEDIVILVDMDDYIIPERVLKRVDDEYKKGAWITYGFFNTLRLQDRGLFGDFLRAYPPGIVTKRDFRTGPWHCWPLRTFRYQLFEGLDPSLFQDWEGKWLRKSTDLALMFPILERCPSGALRFIDDVLYIYRANHANVSRKRVRREIGPDYKHRVHRHLRRMPKQEQIVL